MAVANVCNWEVHQKREKAAFARRFDTEDLGVNYILGMTVKQTRKSKTLSINQPKYVEGVLKRFGMKNCKPMSTPMEVGKKYEPLRSSSRGTTISDGNWFLDVFSNWYQTRYKLSRRNSFKI